MALRETELATTTNNSDISTWRDAKLTLDSQSLRLKGELNELSEKLKVLGKEDASLQQLQSHRENLQIKEEELHMLLTRSAAIIRRVLRLSDKHPLPVSELKQVDMDM